MSRRKMFMEKMGNSTVMFSADYRRDLNSVPSPNVVRFADNSSVSNVNGNFDGSYSYNMKFNPTTAIIILVLFGCFIVMVFYTFCTRRRLPGSADNSRAFRVADLDDGRSAEGVERSVIESFPVFSYNLVKGLKSQAKGSECAVCLTDFEDNEMLRLLPKCSHAFHPECIDTWLCTNTTCPLCRTNLLPHDDSNAPSADLGVAQPPLSHQQLTVVADNRSGVRSPGNDFSNDEATMGTAGDESTGNSLLMVQMELRQGNEWCIVTPDGVTPGLYCSFAAKHQPSASFALPAPHSAEKRSKSERWGNISINPASILRTFSMRVTALDREADRTESSQVGSGSSKHAGKSAVYL